MLGDKIGDLNKFMIKNFNEDISDLDESKSDDYNYSINRNLIFEL